MTTTARQLLDGKPDEIFSVSPATLVIEAIRMMNDCKIGALPVLEQGRLAGILSERDYTRKVILKDRRSSETQVSEIMTAEVKTVAPGATAAECLALMSAHHIRHLPVVDNGALVGMLSVMDVVKNILSEKEFIIEQLEHYITDTA